MADEYDLKTQIAVLAGRINRHKTQQNTSTSPPTHDSRTRSAGYHGRWHPPASRQTFKNKSLVIANGLADASTKSSQVTRQLRHDTLSDGTASLIKAQGTNNSLMTASTYEREQRTKALQKPVSAAVNKQHLHNYQIAQKQNRLNNQALPPPRSSRLIELDGIEYEMKEDGSKLVRVAGREGGQITGKADTELESYRLK